MLPRWHMMAGLIFTILLGILIPDIAWTNLIFVFLSSFLIDFDHYAYAAYKTKSLSLHDSFKYIDKLIKVEKAEQLRGLYRKGPLMVFHTLEFHLFVFLLGFAWQPFFFILTGMVFHSACDVYDQLDKRRAYRREYFLVNWIIQNVIIKK